MATFTSDQIKILVKARSDFVYFMNHIFPLSFKGVFIKGEYVNTIARFLGQNKKTSRISPKGHMKSTSLYAYFMWKLLFEGASNNLEGHYFSFQEQMAGYHVGKIKNLIRENPYYDNIIDKKSLAESAIRYTWDGKHFTTLAPHGLIQFKRGIHGDLIFVDDPFQDPSSEMVLTTIIKINEIFKSNILDMPKEETGELMVVGTPQTRQDFFFDKDVMSRFKTLVLPAINEHGEALWSEYMDLEELLAKRKERGERIFRREYLCDPVYSTKAFFIKSVLKEKAVNEDLTSLGIMTKHDIENRVIGGFDIGRKAHPSHFAVFEEREDKWIMIHQKFMDNWPYSNGKNYFPGQPTQLEYLKRAIESLNIGELYFDNTRGEFMGFMDQGLMPPQMIPVTINLKLKVQMATEFDKAVENQTIELINDDRMLEQICLVTNELKTIPSPTGHADSFWSIGLALLGKKATVSLGGKISTGEKSLFEPGSRIPQDW